MPLAVVVLLHVAVFVLAILPILVLLWLRWYRRASEARAFVRTGYGRVRVVLKGGAICIPILQETIYINMLSLRLPAVCAGTHALATRDNMRADATMEFIVRVRGTEEGVYTAAQTLGYKTMRPEELKTTLEVDFVSAMQAAAAEMSMDELDEDRLGFSGNVQRIVSESLSKYGLEVESVSLIDLAMDSRRS